MDPDVGLMQSGQSAILHRQIGFNVVMSGYRTLMTKPKCDDADVDARL